MANSKNKLRRIFRAKDGQIKLKRIAKVPYTKTKILLLVSESFASWAGVSRVVPNNYSRNLAHLTVHNIKCEKDFIAYIAFCKETGIRFNAVALCPAHGDFFEPCISWNNLASSSTFQMMNECSKITHNVHICACYQGRFLHQLNIPNLKEASGYQKAISANPIQGFQLRYITSGCQETNHGCRQRENFVHINYV